MVHRKFNHALLLTELEKKRAAQGSSVAFRRKTLETQYRTNYTNEFDRVRGEIESRQLRGLPTLSVLKQRQYKFTELAKESLFHTHDIFK